MIPSVAFDFNSICRLCMKGDAKLHPIFGETRNLCSKIKEISPKLEIFDGDGLPAQVCEKCLQQIDISFNFRLQCEESDTVFRHYLTSLLNNQNTTPKSHARDAIDFEEESMVFKEESNMCVLEELKKEPDNNDTQYREESADANAEDDNQELNLEVDAPELIVCEIPALDVKKTETAFVSEELDRSNKTEARKQSDSGNEEVEDFEKEISQINEFVNENDYRCETCSEIFATKESQDQHKCYTPYKCIICMKVLTSEGELCKHMAKHKNEPCRICGKAFSFKSYYLRHMRVHAGIGHRCKHCNKLFPSLHALRIHCRKHTGERPYICEFCGQSFRYNQARNIHLKKHTGERPFQCPICLASFPIKTTLQNHIRTHTGEKPFVCEICGNNFRDSTGLWHHTKGVHAEKEKRFKCRWCPKEYTSNGQLKSHIRLHTGERPYECNVCEKAFAKRYLLTSHIRIHTGEKKYACSVCERTFSSSSSRNRHVRTHTGETPFSCATCGKAFALRRDMVLRNEGDLCAHMFMHDKEPCRLCGKTFKNKSYYLRHMRAHSGLGLRCMCCNKIFSSSSALSIHFRKHTGEKPYVCELCGESFMRPQRYNLHVMKHTDERPFQCPICLKRFSVKINMQNHIRIHTGEKPYVCEICGTSYREQAGLWCHRKNIHTQKERKFKCSVCPRMYMNKRALKAHTRKHTGERPYMCEVCGRAFAVKNVLTKHMVVHTGEKSYDCTVCKRTFSSSSSRDRHVRTHTGETPYGCATCDKAFSLRRDLVNHVFKFRH